ncbi:Uncharacterized protein ToN1_02630 [Aromatoleum petrolei]|nr:Uncharacterized protein ToN1_02630 [Aromatoleum petrolei]
MSSGDSNYPETPLLPAESTLERSSVGKINKKFIREQLAA